VEERDSSMSTQTMEVVERNMGAVQESQ